MQAVCRPKALAKQLVSQYALGENEARFGVVSFNESATTRVGWSTDEAEINAGIDAMEADGKTSISAGHEAARQLFNNSREGATKVVLLVANGEQSNELAANGKTSQQTAIDAAMLVNMLAFVLFVVVVIWCVAAKSLRRVTVAMACLAAALLSDQRAGSVQKLPNDCLTQNRAVIEKI